MAMNLIGSILTLIAMFCTGGEHRPYDKNMQDQQSYTDCIEKYRSAWGEDCSQCPVWKDSYVVYLKNTCEEPIDVMICVQEENRQWKRFHHTSMSPGDSLRAYACVGTGKYLAWGRRAGDESVVFPTLDEVNREYTE